jgi:hypothetical protein
VLNVELLFDLKKDQYLPISTESNDLGIKLKSNFGVKLEMDKSLNHQNPKCFTLSLKMVCDSPYFNADIWQQCWVHNLSWYVQNLSKSSHFLIDKFIWACAWPKSFENSVFSFIFIQQMAWMRTFNLKGSFTLLVHSISHPPRIMFFKMFFALSARFYFQKKFWSHHTGKHPQEELTKFGYKSEKIVPILYKYGDFRKQIPPKLVTLLHFFHKNPLVRIALGFFYCQVAKIHPKKKVDEC